MLACSPSGSIIERSIATCILWSVVDKKLAASLRRARTWAASAGVMLEFADPGHMIRGPQSMWSPEGLVFDHTRNLDTDEFSSIDNSHVCKPVIFCEACVLFRLHSDVDIPCEYSSCGSGTARHSSMRRGRSHDKFVTPSDSDDFFGRAMSGQRRQRCLDSGA